MLVFVLRHADREPEPSDNLSPAGVERANRLAGMLAHSGVSAAFCSDAKRTRQTLLPLKELLDGALPIDAPGDGDPHAVVAAITSLPAATVAIAVGHSNTVDRIVKDLSGRIITPIQPEEFDRLYVVFNPGNAATLLELRY